MGAYLHNTADVACTGTAQVSTDEHMLIAAHCTTAMQSVERASGGFCASVGAGNHSDTFCGVGATLIDTLDTLWLMGMRREFARARDWVADELNPNRCVGLNALLLNHIRGMHCSRRAKAQECC